MPRAPGRAGPRREALDLAAVAPPPVPEVPSLWPALEQRIAARRSPDRSRTSRARESVAERARGWAALDDDRPLRLAWTQDTLREVIEAAGWSARPDRSGRGGRGPSPRAGAGRGRIAGASLAASILAILVVLPVTWRVRAAADAKIHENAAPVAMSVGPAGPTEAKLPDPIEPASASSRDIPAGHLAQAEPIKPPADPPPSNDAASGSKSGTTARYGYDLEHGTPMPLDGRDAKPVY